MDAIDQKGYQGLPRGVFVTSVSESGEQLSSPFLPRRVGASEDVGPIFFVMVAEGAFWVVMIFEFVAVLGGG